MFPKEEKQIVGCCGLNISPNKACTGNLLSKSLCQIHIGDIWESLWRKIRRGWGHERMAPVTGLTAQEELKRPRAGICMSFCTLSLWSHDALRHVTQQQSSHKMWSPNLELRPNSTLRDTLIIFVSYYLWFWVTAAQHILGWRATQHVFKEDT